MYVAALLCLLFSRGDPQKESKSVRPAKTVIFLLRVRTVYVMHFVVIRYNILYIMVQEELQFKRWKEEGQKAHRECSLSESCRRCHFYCVMALSCWMSFW